MILDPDEPTIRLCLEHALADAPARLDAPGAEPRPLIAPLIHDLFGGDLLRTGTSVGAHFYNRFSGRAIDFAPPRQAQATIYENRPAKIEDAIARLDPRAYEALKARFLWRWALTPRPEHRRRDVDAA